MSEISVSASSGLTEDQLDRLARLERLDALDRRDRRDACAAAEAAAVRLGRLDRLDSFDAEAQGRALLKRLVDECGQDHLVSRWPRDRAASADERRLQSQLLALHRSLAGGLDGYVCRARELLEASRLGRNPLDGYRPSLPVGETLDFGRGAFLKYEEEGLAAMRGAAFVLVAGGLGERLGASGIKLDLPAELATGTSYLALYAQHILALGAAAGSAACLPLVLMTSDDTHARTLASLEAGDYFGLDRRRVFLLRQQAVPCLADAGAALAVDPSDASRVLTKPNGHGEVHRLLHSSGLAAKLHSDGCTHLVFFQDTNGLVFNAVPAALGVSVRRGLALNFVSVRRRAGDASGALIELVRERGDGDSGGRVLANVEYNQLEPLLRAASAGASGDEPDPGTGWSPYPGNCNQLVVALRPYVEVLAASGGVVPEFVNPKYSDASRCSFKKPTRLECMMQDLPWLLHRHAPPHAAPVSFTAMDGAFTYAPAKNSLAEARKNAAAGRSPASASSAELSLYAANCSILRLAGAALPPPAEATVAGVQRLPATPWVVLTPAFKPSVGIALSRFCGGAAISLTASSGLLLDGDITVHSLSLDGALRISAVRGARVTVRALQVRNAGWRVRELSPEEAADEATPEVLRLRGYALDVLEERVLHFGVPGEHIVDEA
eukprot:CAMPEP_0185290268 /NCGR_PEP_ID=MMETSP1363-20130426/4462_1 /TAXON_ID=38817 /ORGANISM="Gephyrocapsa oceanica, Strain RCC1303" /LENGTH=665 /DNA_ID=CAMNT_0027886247 /DNA_START=17 /DNA_END=2014 /DNA_ORIENTATION=-